MGGTGLGTVLVTTASVPFLAAADPAADPWSLLTGLGPVGAIVVLLIWGKLRTENEVKGLEARLDVYQRIVEQKDQQILALTNGYTEKAMPTLARAIAVLERYEHESRGRGNSP